MKKFKKILLFIIIALLLCLAITFVVLYISNKELANDLLNKFVDFINKPLVIAGVSTTIGGAFLYFIINYIVSNARFGKNRLEEYEEKVKQIEKAKSDFELAANEKVKDLQDYNDKLVGFIKDICNLSTNQKIKNYGKELLSYGKETIDSETKAD